MALRYHTVGILKMEKVVGGQCLVVGKKLQADFVCDAGNAWLGVLGMLGILGS